MKLYREFLSMHLKSVMQHKVSFFLLCLGQFITSFTVFLGVWFMFIQFKGVDGFTFDQVLLCFSVVTMAFSLAECFGRGFDLFAHMLGNGEFDRVLVRPRSIVFLVLASKTNFTRLGRVLQSALILAYAMPHSGVIWTWDKLLTMLLMIFCGMIIFFDLFLINASLSFFTVQGLEVMNIFTDGGREFGRYPFSIYGKEMLRFLTYIIPLALFQYYPLLYLLDMAQNPLYMLAPLLGLLFTLPAYLIWRLGLRHYHSTGS